MELWLENYCYPDCEPMKNIMLLPEAEAYALAAKLAKDHPQTTAFYRFADFHNYYPRRMKTDAMLYEMFVSLGGQPACRHPLSFVLEGSPFLREWFGGGIVTRVPLSSLEVSRVSCTLGDSMSTLDRDGSLTMLTGQQLVDRVAAHPEGTAGFLRETEQHFRYVEVQLWDAFPASLLPFVPNRV